MKKIKAFALVHGDQQDVLCVSDCTAVLYATGAEMLEPSGQCQVRFSRQEKEICKANGAYVVRIEYTLGDRYPRLPRNRKEKH